ncbi:MAG: hypothetical protein P4L66_08145 [Acetobacteraceae bacterium]|nr:hypothetical protein [Acetobacteraceae bacterium]
MINGIKCGNCRWWVAGIHHTNYRERTGEIVGDCRAEPPRIVTEFDRAELNAAWPVTQDYHWCAAHRLHGEGGAA